MLNSTVIVSQLWYYNEAILSKLGKKTQKIFFSEKKTRYLHVNRKSLSIKDGLNILTRNRGRFEKSHDRLHI